MLALQSLSGILFFFNDTATTEIYTLSLHDALPIFSATILSCGNGAAPSPSCSAVQDRSEEHTSELQSHSDLVCRLLLEKKNRQSRRGDEADRRTRDPACSSSSHPESTFPAPPCART